MPSSSYRSGALALLVGLFVLLAAPGASAFNLFGAPKAPAVTGVAKVSACVYKDGWSE